MTDRELLEKAAKAAGIDAICWNDGSEPYSSGEGIIYGDNHIWNPLTYDGDALRLAHGLNVPVSIDISKGLTTVSSWDFEIDVPHGNDPLAATRRAIVKAAAAIGESL